MNQPTPPSGLLCEYMSRPGIPVFIRFDLVQTSSLPEHVHMHPWLCWSTDDIISTPRLDGIIHIFHVSVLAILDTEGAWLCKLHLDVLVVLLLLATA